VKILLTILAAGLTLAFNTPALLAQDGESEVAGAVLTLEEVIVTAQRREQNLQDVPMSISSFDGDMLKEVGIPSFQQLADITPSLTVTNQTTWTGGVNIYLRGQGGGAFNRDPAVGIYINEAYVSDATSILNTFLDVERVETLIGPQGTLWGRNTMAGAMNIVLKGPTEEFETDFYAEIGNYNTKRAAASISGSMTDTLKGRLSVNYLQQDSYVEDIDRGNIKSQDLTAVRGMLTWDPTVNFTAELTLSATNDRSHSPFLPSAKILEGTPMWAVAEWYGEEDMGIDDDPFTNSSDIEPLSTYRENFGILNLNWQFADKWKLRWLNSKFETDADRQIDIDGSRAPLAAYPSFTQNDTFSSELQIQFESDNVHVVAGLYYFDQEWELDGGFYGNVDLLSSANCNNAVGGDVAPFAGTVFNQSFLAPIFGGPIGECAGFFLDLATFAPIITGRPPFPLWFGPGGFVEQIIGRPLSVTDYAQGGTLEQFGLDFYGYQLYNAFNNIRTVESKAAYFNVDWDISDQWRINFGGRYTDETQGVAQTGANMFGFPETGMLSTFALSGEASFDKFTPKGGIDFRPNDDTLFYLSYSKGFLPGEMNPSTGTFGPQQLLDAYELGWKTRLADGKLIFNGALFYYDYQNFLQTVYSTSPVDGSLQSIPLTFDKVETKGIEISGSWLPVENLVISFDALWLDTGIKKVGESAGVDLENLIPSRCGLSDPTCTVDVSDLNVSITPDKAATLRANYTWLLNRGSINLGGALAWNDEYALDLYGETFSEAKTLLNANLRYTSANGNWYVNLYGTNLTDKEYIVSDIYYFEYGVTQYPGTPRMYGLQLGYNYR